MTLSNNRVEWPVWFFQVTSSFSNTQGTRLLCSRNTVDKVAMDPAKLAKRTVVITLVPADKKHTRDIKKCLRDSAFHTPLTLEHSHANPSKK